MVDVTEEPNTFPNDVAQCAHLRERCASLCRDEFSRARRHAPQYRRRTYQRHDSSWTFPNQVAEFTRIGAPQDVDGTVDVVAHYARTTESVRTTAIVDVYPTDSAAAQARYADALTALRSESPAEAAQIEQTIHIEGSLPLTAVKTYYKAASKDGTKPQSSLGHSVLYFIDTGYWIVKIRTRMPRLDTTDLAASDAFVLHQPWESLGLTKESCTGPACASSDTAQPQS